MKTFRLWLLGMGWAMAALAAQAQSDTIILKRAADLREAPGEASRSVASLPAQTTLTRMTARQGPWIEVRTPQGVSGWIHMFDLGAASAPAQGGNAATGALRGLTGMLAGGAAAPRTAAVSTIGIRGLGAEDIANAQPNLAALTVAEAMRVDAAQAQAFGQEAALAPQAVAPLPVPPPVGKGAPANTKTKP